MTSTDPLALPQPTHPPSHPRPDMGDLGKMKVLWISSRLLQGHWLFCGPYGFRVIFLKKERQNGTGWEGNSYSEGDVRWGRQAHEKSRWNFWLTSVTEWRRLVLSSLKFPASRQCGIPWKNSLHLCSFRCSLGWLPLLPTSVCFWLQGHPCPLHQITLP